MQHTKIISGTGSGPRSTRSLLVSAAVLVFGLVLALAIAEALLRVFDVAPTDTVHTVDAAEFAALPGMLSPVPTLVDRRNPALPHRVTINELGFRGAPFPRAKPAGEFRILYIGDSFAYGDFVNDDETLPAQLERVLRRHCGNVRVVNAGLPGSTVTEHAPMVRRALALSPDLVLEAFTENDVTDLSVEPMWDVLQRNRETKSAGLFGLLYPALRRTALWNLWLTAKGRLRRDQQQRGGGALAARDPQADPTPTASLRERYATVFRALRDEVRGRGIPLVVVDYPSHNTLYGRATQQQLEWVEKMVADAGVPVIPVLPALRATGEGERNLYLLPHDGHPSARGYEVAATAIGVALESSPPLASRCTGGR